MDILEKGKLLLWLFFIAIINSCGGRNDEKDLKKQAKEVEIKINTFNATYVPEFQNIRLQLLDSMKNWRRLDIKPILRFYPYQIDTLICFNNAKDKLITTLNSSISTKAEDTFSDQILYIYGTKIRGRWYFFSGPGMVIQREKNKPSSFIKLHELAVDYVFQHYLYQDKTGVLKINDSFFSDFTSAAWGVSGWPKPKTKYDYDKVYLWSMNFERKGKGHYLDIDKIMGDSLDSK
jgi:hypothetical protein